MNKNQIVLSSGSLLTEKELMSAIDNVIIDLYNNGNINVPTQVLNTLNMVEDISGHAKAKLLYKMDEWWRQNKADENFTDHIESTTDTKPVTVRRYVQTWKYIEDYTIPKEIAQRPMRELVPIASHLAQGYDLSKEQWRKIKLSSTSSEVGAILRDAKGKPARKSARVIKLSRDGSLTGYKDNKKYFIGFLNIKEAEGDSVLAEFIEKIKIGSGVIEE